MRWMLLPLVLGAVLRAALGLEAAPGRPGQHPEPSRLSDRASLLLAGPPQPARV